MDGARAAPLWMRRRDSRWFASCFAPVHATCSRERQQQKGAGSAILAAIGRRGMIADIHSSFGYMRFRNNLRRPGLTSICRKKFAVGTRSLQSPQDGSEDRLRAQKPQVIVFPASLRQFVGVHSLKMLLGAPYVLVNFGMISKLESVLDAELL